MSKYITLFSRVFLNFNYPEYSSFYKNFEIACLGDFNLFLFGYWLLKLCYIYCAM